MRWLHAKTILLTMTLQVVGRSASQIPQHLPTPTLTLSDGGNSIPTPYLILIGVVCGLFLLIVFAVMVFCTSVCCCRYRYKRSKLQVGTGLQTRPRLHRLVTGEYPSLRTNLPVPPVIYDNPDELSAGIYTNIVPEDAFQGCEDGDDHPLSHYNDAYQLRAPVEGPEFVEDHYNLSNVASVSYVSSIPSSASQLAMQNSLAPPRSSHVRYSSQSSVGSHTSLVSNHSHHSNYSHRSSHSHRSSKGHRSSHSHRSGHSHRSSQNRRDRKPSPARQAYQSDTESESNYPFPPPSPNHIDEGRNHQGAPKPSPHCQSRYQPSPSVDSKERMMEMLACLMHSKDCHIPHCSCHEARRSFFQLCNEANPPAPSHSTNPSERRRKLHLPLKHSQKFGHIFPLKEILLTPTIEPLDLPENHPQFCDPVEIIHCDSSGGVYHNPIHGITLRIPEGAIPHGMVLKISIGVCLYGNFIFPESLSPVSAIVWLCTQNRSDFRFLKPVEMIVPHFLDCQSAEDAKSLEMCFLKATHQPSTAEKFLFLPSGLMDFISLPDRGILHTQHFCFNCIAANISNDQLKKERCCITCAVPRPIASWSTMYFYITYDILTCCDNLEQLIHREGLHIEEERRFHFSSQSGMPCGLRGKKQVQHSSSGNSVTVTLQPRTVKIEELGFWQLYKDKRLELLMKRKQYPPNMRLKIGELPPTEEQIVTVTFEGTRESEEDMAIYLTIPSNSSNIGSLYPQPYQVRPTAVEPPTLHDIPTIRQLTLLKSPTPIRILQRLAVQWETLGYTIDFDPQGDCVQLIRVKHEREGPLSCCRRVLIDWLNGMGSYQPANWGNLIEILEDMNEIHLARDLRDMISVCQPRTTSHAAVLETLC